MPDEHAMPDPHAMSDEHGTHILGGDEIAGGPREPGRPRRARLVAWSTLSALGVAAAAVGVYVATASGGGSAPVAALGVDVAATSNPTPSGGASHSPGTPGKHPLGPKGFGGTRFGVLHGEWTVKTADGTKIVDEQLGELTAVDASANTITVTSSDKVAFTYVVNSKTVVTNRLVKPPTKATLADVKKGDTVRVLATRSGDVRTAESIADGLSAGTAQPQARPTGQRSGMPGPAWGPHGAGGPGGHWGPGGKGPGPLPTPSVSAASA